MQAHWACLLPIAMSECSLIDLDAIDRSLREVQADFVRLNNSFEEPRDLMIDAVRLNMLAGYAEVDRLVRAGVDLLNLHQLDHLLELNTIVLCGTDPVGRKEFAQHIAATEARFYEGHDGGIGDLLEWYGRHRDESVWKRAAGTFVRILSRPQLFIEGNHRTGSLVASYLLMREGLPPFVLTRENAQGFFDPATVVRRIPKHGVHALFELPKIKKRFAAFLEKQSRAQFLRGPVRKG